LELSRGFPPLRVDVFENRFFIATGRTLNKKEESDYWRVMDLQKKSFIHIIFICFFVYLLKLSFRRLFFFNLSLFFRSGVSEEDFQKYVLCVFACLLLNFSFHFFL
jgi:hypothetical protein